MTFSHSNPALRARVAGRGGHQQSVGEGMEVEAAIEAIGDSAEVAFGVLAEAEGMVGTAEAGFDIAQDRVHPVEQRQLFGLTPAHDRGLMRTAGVGDASETGQAIGDDGAGRAEVGDGPRGDRLAGEAGQLSELGPQRVSVIIERDRGEEGHLVLRSAPGGAVVEFAAEVGIVDLDGSAQHIVGFAFDHGLHQLMVNEPGGGITDPQVALQSQGREPGLGLADEVHRQKPHRQPQLGALEHAARDQRGLVMAGVALEGLARSDPKHAVRGTTTARAAKALRPARLLQCGLALRLGTKPLEQLKQRHPGLKLNPIHGHDTPLWRKPRFRVRPLVAQFVSLAEDSF